jgi:hypothetical protein
MKEKMNQPFYYPETPQGTWKSFMQIVMDNLKEGTITAYDDDKFILPKNYNEIMKGTEKTHKKTLIRPGTEIEYDTTIIETFQTIDVKKLDTQGTVGIRSSTVNARMQDPRDLPA